MRPSRPTLGVDGADDALGAELGGDLGDQLGTLDRGGVHAHLVGAGAQHAAGIFQRADAAADGERDVHLVGDPAHHLDGRVAVVARRCDVEEHQLVGTLEVVAGGQLDRIAGIAQVDEVGALDDATVGDVETRDDTGDLHDDSSDARSDASAASASATVKRPS